METGSDFTSELIMVFLIDNRRIDLENYKLLRNYYVDYPYLKDLVSSIEEWLNPELTHISFSSSGTTGTPKLIQHSKKAIIQSASYTKDYFAYGQADTALLCLPVRYVAGKMMLYRAILSDLQLVLVKPSSLALKNIDQRIDFAPLTPMQLYQTFKLFPEKLSHFSKILLGGASITGELLERINNQPSDIYHSYGMAETLTHVAIRKLNGENASDYFTSISPEISFRIDEDSCLNIDTPHLGHIKTRDIVELLDKSRFRWLSRKDNVINSGALKLVPEKMEPLIESLVSCPAMIFGMPDPVLGNRICLALETNNSEMALEKLKNLSLPFEKQLYPRDLYLIPEFEYTATGKLDRKRTMQKAERLQSLQL